MKKRFCPVHNNNLKPFIIMKVFMLLEEFYLMLLIVKIFNYHYKFNIFFYKFENFFQTINYILNG